MSIRYIVGNPGSGKTYLAVNDLYENFIIKQEQKYDYAYTNINEFDFSKFPENVINLDIDLFIDKLTDLYNLYLDKATDTELCDKAKELEILNSLIVIDECHSNIFAQKNNKIIIWWLTYHRHLHQDIWLITQNLSLIDTKYKKIAEFFYKAVDGSKRLFRNRLKYVLFNSPTMFQKRDIVPGGGISLKFNPEIYALYKSGADTNSKSYLKIYLLIIFLLIVLVFFLYLVFSNLFKNNENNTIKDKNSTIIYNKKETKNNNIYFDFDMYPYNIRCYDEKCYISEIDVYIPEKFLKKILSSDSSSLIFWDFSEYIKGEYRYFLIFNKDIFKNFIKRLNDEKDSKNNGFSILGGGG